MTDEQRLQMVTEQLILVRDNLFRGMSKSIQKLQAQSINEVLELPSHTESLPAKRTWVGLTDEEILNFGPGQPDAVWSYEDQLYFARAIEAALRSRNENNRTHGA